MKNFLTSLIFSFSCLLVSAQQDRFIYLQTENKQPFFVKLNNRVFNSSPLGYLIIPKLDDGLYSLVIGFPETDYEQEFNCSVNKKDVGFLIKSVGEKQWQLLNVQTNNVIVPGDVITKPIITYEKETNPFSTMLANAVHDSTILRKDVAKEVFPEKQNELIVKDTSQTTAVTNSAVSKPDSNLVADSGKDVAKVTVPERRVDSTERKLSDTSNAPVITRLNDNKVSDSAKDVAKKIVPDKSNESNQTDSILTVTINDIVISKPDSVINNNQAKLTPEKSGELVQKDTAQTIILNDVAVTKSKKKKSKKNENALQDSTLQQKEIVKVVPEKIVERNDTAQTLTVNNDVVLLKSKIKRKLKKTGKDGIEMVYVDDYGGTKDTIRILIPSENKKKKEGEIRTEAVVSVKNDKPKEVIPDKNKSEYKITKQEKEIIKEANREPVVISTMINSDCKNFATEDDFLKTRKKMVAENNDDDMIKSARKIFKTKCFTTEQIKNLSVLFLQDEGKYMFFEAAYPFVSDSDLYSTLEKQLSDNDYITRFRAMIHK